MVKIESCFLQLLILTIHSNCVQYTTISSDLNPAELELH